ncbi:MAG: DUF3987 domain-containing protein [Candidatus Riflebacteria bacterium]|nr:DUF3987 domain-containing protein [Candidatus Riflebacteria bacterium]
MINKEISFFENARSIKPTNFKIEKIIEQIKTDGALKSKIESLRKLPQKDYDEQKKQLPGVTFSGTFSQRKKECLKILSGYMILDFDHIDQPGTLQNSLIADSHCAFCFISPSGKGLKVGIRTNDLSLWEANFKSAEKYFSDKYKLQADKSGKDVSRLCFLSHDPNCFFNPQAEVIPIIEESKKEEPKKSTQPERKVANHEVDERIKKYCQKALIDAVEKIRFAPEGSRNKTLNDEAHCIGELTATRYLFRGEAESVLRVAAREAGLTESEIEKTLKSGLDSGEKTPRDFAKIDWKALPIPDIEELKQRAERVLTQIENPCGTFDTSVLPKILQEYIDHICSTTDAEPITVTGCLLSLISGFLKLHVYIREDDYKSPPRMVYFQRLYTNLYQLNVLSSGLFKTTALNRAFRIGYQKRDEIERAVKELKEGKSGIREKAKEANKKKPEDFSEQELAEFRQAHENLTKLENQDPFLPQKATAEGLLDVELGSGKSGTIYLSEFGAWLQNLQKTYNLDLKAIFTDFFDVPESWTTTTKGSGRKTIKHPFISICGVSTVDWVKESICHEDISSGFFARFLMFNPPGKKIVPPAMPVRRPGMNQEIEGKIRDILFNRIPENRAYILSQEAYDCFNSIHAALYSTFEELPEQSRKLLEPYLKRWSPYILKLSMIMQFMTDPNTNEIGMDAILSGAAVVEYAIKSTTYLFQTELGMSKHQDNCRRILGYVARRTKEKKITTWGDILQSNILKEGVKGYEEVISHLVESGSLDEIPSTPKKTTRYILKNGFGEQN